MSARKRHREVADLGPMLSIILTAHFVGVTQSTVAHGLRRYVARIEAIERKTGERVEHDSDEALPRDNEFAGRYMSERILSTDGRRHGGAPRIYRDLLLWKVYGVRDYGHRPADKMRVAS